MKSTNAGYDRTCPYCQYKADSSASLDPDVSEPEAGDAGLCINCGEFAIFVQVSDELHFRKTDDDELQSILEDETAAAAQKWVKEHAPR
jgi:hypothetical protein